MSIVKTFLTDSHTKILMEISSGKREGIFNRVKRNYLSLYNTSPKNTRALDILNDEHISYIVELLEDIDPTNNGKYMNWLADIIFKDENLRSRAKRGTYSLMTILDDDARKIKNMLLTFDKSKNDIRREGHEIDINKYNSIGDLYSVTKKFSEERPEDPKGEDEIVSNRYYVNTGNAVIVSESSDRIIVHPKTLEASEFYGCNSNWCTTYSRNFDDYNENGILLIFVSKTGEERTQLFLPSQNSGRGWEWRDMADHTYISEYDVIMSELTPQELSSIHSYVEKEIGLHEVEKIVGETYGGFFFDNEGYISFKGDVESLASICNWGDATEKFVIGILTGDQFIDIDYYAGTEDAYNYVDINHTNMKKMLEFIYKNYKDEFTEYIESEDIDVDKLDTDEMIKFVIDHDVYELKEVLDDSYRYAEESATYDYYYTSFKEHILDSFDADDWEFDGEKVIMRTGERYEMDLDHRLYELFGSSLQIDVIVDDILDNLESYSYDSRHYISVEDDLINEYLADKLYEI